MKWITIIVMSIWVFTMQAQSELVLVSLEVKDDHNMALAEGGVFVDNGIGFLTTDKDGFVQFQVKKNTEIVLHVYYESYETKTINFSSVSDTSFVVYLNTLEVTGEQVVVSGMAEEIWMSKLRDVQNTAIYASKKTELIVPGEMVMNDATNNARQLFARVPGLNIWENDAAGLQLGIGARGLDPNRTAHFNTRQNGYDISADALGYPESYYTPPTEAIKQIELVRGAASLQYGPQLGGLLNFKLKDGNIGMPFQTEIGMTVGSYGFYDAHITLEGEKRNWQYFVLGKHKMGNGWRENSKFSQDVFMGTVTFKPLDKLKLKADLTYMSYMAQQPGGLVDHEFSQNAQQSKRSRNWFNVNWFLMSLLTEYELTPTLKSDIRLFHLDASRMALGELGPINRPDPMRERDLVSGVYNNYGVEWRVIQRYKIDDQFQHLLIGARYYHGLTHNKQGLADDGVEANFNFINPSDVEQSDYDFPSQNAAVFVEHLFNVNNKWSITPGVRYEHIETIGKGFYKHRVVSGGQVLIEEKIYEDRQNSRNIVLMGLGSSYRPSGTLECYANFSQNYRSINFSDLTISNPNLVIDRNLKDESGYNLDIGIRGQDKNGMLWFDLSVFYLNYSDRIGLAEKRIQDDFLGEKIVAYRTNIGDAGILGVESYLKTRFELKEIGGGKFVLQPYVNLSIIQSQYLDGLTGFSGNKVELVAPLLLKTGLQMTWRNWSLSYLFSYTQEHFSDATNAVKVADATRGVIPSYWVHDLTLAYDWRQFRIKLSGQNLMDRSYFTRRATGYPGPGIIPAEGRTFFLSINYKFSLETTSTELEN